MVGQRAGDGDALLLAAGELHRAVVHARAEADHFEAFLGARVDVADILAGVAQGQADVLERVLPRPAG